MYNADFTVIIEENGRINHMYNDTCDVASYMGEFR